jgi:hypothetical protein
LEVRCLRDTDPFLVVSMHWVGNFDLRSLSLEEVSRNLNLQVDSSADKEA